MIPRLAELIAEEEGYGIPGALPTRDNNPGDLRHSPHSFHLPSAPDAIGQIDTPVDGWEDLVRQLNLYLKRVPPMTLAQAIFEWAPISENDSMAYLVYVSRGLGVSSDIPLTDALQIPGIGVYVDEPS